MNNLVVSLDLDETLIHSKLALVDNMDFNFKLSNGSFVFKRPGLDRFLSFIDNNELIEFGFFSRAGEQYVTEIVNEICKEVHKKPLFVFSFNRMTVQQDFSMYSSFSKRFIKDLEKVKRCTKVNFDRMVAIDDLSQYPRQRGNFLKVLPFVADNEEDHELLRIEKILSFLSTQKNVRNFIKNSNVELKD